jgi:hypothetical protein
MFAARGIVMDDMQLVVLCRRKDFPGTKEEINCRELKSVETPGSTCQASLRPCLESELKPKSKSHKAIVYPCWSTFVIALAALYERGFQFM